MPLAKLKRGFAGKWAVLPGFAMLFLSGICWAASVGRGWYSIKYSAASGDYCQIPLWECSLAACKKETTYTGFSGAGTACGQYTLAQVCFVIAAIYSLLYVWFMAGGFTCATVKNEWGKLDPGNCCLDTTADTVAGCPKLSCLFTKCTPASVCCNTPEGVFPHGCTFCVTPAFMLVGLMLVLTSSESPDFKGIPDAQKGMGWLFYVMLLFTILGFCICGCMMRLDPQTGHAKAGAAQPRPAAAGGAQAGYGGGAKKPAAKPAAAGKVGIPKSAQGAFYFYTTAEPTPVQCASDGDVKKHKKAGKFVAGTTFVSIAGGAWTPIQSCGPDFKPLYA